MRCASEYVSLSAPGDGAGKKQVLHRHWAYSARINDLSAGSSTSGPSAEQCMEGATAGEKRKGYGKPECRRRGSKIFELCNHGSKVLCNGYFPSALPEATCSVLHPALCPGRL